MLDITGAELVDIEIRHDGEVIWVNVDGACVLRICRIQNVIVNDNRLLIKVQYIGSIPEFQGRTALLNRDTAAVQFDDKELQHPVTGLMMGFNWHLFPAKDFEPYVELHSSQ